MLDLIGMVLGLVVLLRAVGIFLDFINYLQQLFLFLFQNCVPCLGLLDELQILRLLFLLFFVNQLFRLNIILSELQEKNRTLSWLTIRNSF